ncbi:MAG: dihydropteroate synthase [Rhodospirillaceae bacterium]|mgnify:FL=1|nr:dihydropteroate synthase [Rhodospirillaceae bacterium]OUT78278.1 MAG: dihydropteroate synthase [Rhodospirillaceae bacterium TMED23]
MQIKTSTQNHNQRSKHRFFAELPLNKPLIMGILNVTPDSFTDGGKFLDPLTAIKHAEKLVDEGADIIDIGGESTRPGAISVDLEEECRRILPVIKDVVSLGAAVSIDTQKSNVMRRAIDLGVSIINDVSALESLDSRKVISDSGVSVILMHKRGHPRSMMENITYDNIINDLMTYFSKRIESCLEAGIDKHQIAIDPGFGFGKSRDQNLLIIKNLWQFRAHDCPILVGLSRKFGKHKDALDRLPESLAVVVNSVINGADIVRVHDVAETKDALAAIRYEHL